MGCMDLVLGGAPGAGQCMLSPGLYVPRVPAGVSSSATISEGSGSTSGAVLKVLRPTSVSDDTVASYMIQAYSDAEGSTKVRHGVPVCGS